MLLVLLIVSITTFILTIESEILNTIIIFLSVTFTGFFLCRRMVFLTGDLKLNILSNFWLIKIAVTLLLLYMGWIPGLSPESPNWGYDPQRYYMYAQSLIESNWIPTYGINYHGIVFYYAFIFFLFGINPVIPALINIFITLLGTLYLINISYRLKLNKINSNWVFSFLLLIPEFLWYDVMTARETLMAIMIIFSTIPMGEYIANVNSFSLIKTLALFLFCSAVILMVRTSMVIPVVVSLLAMIFIFKSRYSALKKLLTVMICIGATTIGMLIQNYIGGEGTNLLSLLESLQSFEGNIASQMDWGSNSIGLLIAPNNFWQAILFTPIRMLLYLAAPLPSITISMSELADGGYQAWQNLLVIPTSITMLLGFPYVLAGTALAWRSRKSYSEALIIPTIFWITFITVAGGNIIIHERYRVMFTLLLFFTMLFGFTGCSRINIRFWALGWYGLLVLAILFYLLYKII